MAFTHNLLVVGAGAAGLGAAGAAAAFGLDVALIDTKAKNFGGDCLNYGCVPSKTLLHVAHYFAGARAAERFGLSCSGRADFAKVMNAVHTAIETIRKEENPEAFAREHGVETIVGRARFVDPHTLAVEDRRLSAPRIVLATGSRPRPQGTATALTNKIYAYPVRSRLNQKAIRQWQQHNLSPRLMQLAGW